MQRAHRLAIPFENLDIPLGRGISLDPDAVFAKLVTNRRGGYCFEQNQLFARALTAMGFAVRPLLGRVWLMAQGVPPRTHTLLLVTLEGEEWIADAGFGGSFAPPMKLKAGMEVQTPDGAAHRLLRDAGHGWMLERAGDWRATDGRNAPHHGWQPQYSFTLDPVAPMDLELSNHWTATRPDTRFTNMLVASIILPDGFAALTDRRLSITCAGGNQAREITDAADYRATLAARFGIELDPEQAAMLLDGRDRSTG